MIAGLPDILGFRHTTEQSSCSVHYGHWCAGISLLPCSQFLEPYSARADFDLMYGIAEFLWGAVLGKRSAAWLFQASDEQ